MANCQDHDWKREAPGGLPPGNWARISWLAALHPMLAYVLSAPIRIPCGTPHNGNTRAVGIPRFRQIRPKHPGRSSAGFSLLELMIVITILSILMGIAAPAMNSFLRNDQLTAQINTLTGHLAHARSTAVTRHQSTVLCASDDQATCSSNDWADGWVLFVDVDNDADLSAADEILIQYRGLPDNISLRGSMGNKVIYDGRGFAANTFGNFALCDDRGDEHMKSISIQRTGRVHHGGAASC